MPERRIRPEDVEFELGKDAEKAEPIPLVRKESQELLAEMLAPSKDVREATAEIMRLQALREKPTISKEDAEMLEKAVDDMLAFVESRTEALRVAEEDLEALASSDRSKQEMAIEAKKFASLRAETEELHQLARAADTVRALNLAMAVEGRGLGLNEGVEIGMRISAAHDAIRSLQEMRAAVVGLMLRSDNEQIIERCGEMMRRLEDDVAHEQRIIAIATGKQAARIDLIAEGVLEQAHTAAEGYPEAAELEADTGMLQTASLDTMVEDLEDIFAPVAEEVSEVRGFEALKAVEEATDVLEAHAARTEGAMERQDWQEAALASKDLHAFSAVVSDAVNAHLDGMVERRAQLTGLDYAMMRLEAADDAERIFSGMLDLAVERMERAPEGERSRWADSVERLRRAIDTERASREAAQGLIDTLRASAAE